jgi:hypothetical protein
MTTTEETAELETPMPTQDTPTQTGFNNTQYPLSLQRTPLRTWNLELLMRATTPLNNFAIFHMDGGLVIGRLSRDGTVFQKGGNYDMEGAVLKVTSKLEDGSRRSNMLVARTYEHAQQKDINTVMDALRGQYLIP